MGCGRVCDGMSDINVTRDLLDATIRDLYAPPMWTTATEVQFHIPGGKRFADLVAVQLSGNGHEVHGFEAKVSRGDWLHELKQADKAEPAMTQCDKWWLLAGSPDVYREHEVPEQWGIIAPGPSGMEIVRGAKYLHERRPVPTPWDRHFMAAFMSRAHADAGLAAGLVHRTAAQAERKGYAKGLSAARRRAPVVAARGQTKPRYDPGRYNLDDGIPLDLP